MHNADINSNEASDANTSVVGAKRFQELDAATNDLSHRVIGAALEVHRALGPGHFESVYERALRMELDLRGVPFRAQTTVSVFYKNVVVGEYVPDLIIDNRLIVELKAVEKLSDVHLAQTLAYLRASNLRLGLLINFQVALLRTGIKRVIT